MTARNSLTTGYPFKADLRLYDDSGQLEELEAKDFCTLEQWTRLPNPPGLFRIMTIISVLSILVILVVFGNALVIAAVMLRRRLRSATGLLILSLAVADLLVGLVILPFSIANEVLDSFWIFGDAWCTAWLTMDIWMCTASIYNLVAISIDRYIAIIKPLNYPMLITKFRARCIVAGVWISSFIICSPSFLLASSEKKRPHLINGIINREDCRCTPSNSGMAYIVFSASSSFYVPMMVVVFVYVRIYIAACAATKSAYCGMMQITAVANKNPKSILMQNPSALSRSEVPTLRVHRGSTPKVALQAAATKEFESQSCPKSEGQGTTSVPISINSSVPSVYAQMNGSNSNLAFLCGRRRLSGDIAQNQPKGRGSETRASMTEMGNGGGGETPLMDAAENLPRSITNETNSFEMTRLYPQDEAHRDVGQSGEQTLRPQYLHPAVRPEAKKRSYSIGALAKIIRRGPKKRGGGAYEKRLSLEIKAAKTVAIVTGCFIFCWLGFSILYGFSFAFQINEVVWSIVFWLGYLNSALNVFNREFRTCFKKLLTCNHLLFANRSANQTTMCNSYNSQFRGNKQPAGYSSISAAPTYGKLQTNLASPPVDGNS